MQHNLHKDCKLSLIKLMQKFSKSLGLKLTGSPFKTKINQSSELVLYLKVAKLSEETACGFDSPMAQYYQKQCILLTTS